jgi:hypothetical protein
MHDIEPFYAWEDLYIAAYDERSPFFGRQYHETLCTHSIYNYYIHPKWDEIGSATLYTKVLFADYEERFCVIELIGEWNDYLYNDVMYLKRNLVEPLLKEGITRFILIGENVLNFHADDDSYYQEWFEDLDDGWIALINFRDHIIDELRHSRLGYYLNYEGLLRSVNWRTLTPRNLLAVIEHLMMHKLNE